MARSAYKISQIPDLDLIKYQTLSESGVGGVLERHNAFLRQWNSMCFLNGISMHLLYIFSPDKSSGNRLEIWFILQGAQENLLAVESVLLNSPLSDYYNFVNSDEPKLMHFSSAAVLNKRERIVPLFSDGETYENFYYVPEWKVNEDARLYDLCRMFDAISASDDQGIASAYRIDLYPTETMQDFRFGLSEQMTKLRKLTGSNSESVRLTQNQASIARDEISSDVLKQMEKWVEKTEITPSFRVNIYAFSDTIVHAKMILGAVGSEALQEGNYVLRRIGADADGKYNCYSRMESPRNYCETSVNFSTPELEQWSTTFTHEEVQPFFRFPALFEGETIQIPKETAPTHYRDGLFLGLDKNGFETFFSLHQLTKHAFVCGVPGSGKTNTLLHLASSLHKDFNVPFLVLEPAKKEYRALFNSDGFSDVLLFSPHMKSLFPMRVNPFEFPHGMILSEHIAALMRVFSGTFSLQGATSFLLDRAIESAYMELGWYVDSVNDGSRQYPTIRRIYELLEKAIAASGYEGEIKSNLQAFLQVRLGSFLNRDAGEIFNVSESSVLPEDWLKLSAIIELEALGESTKNFMILLLCTYITESLRITSKQMTSSVRHVLFIEEAHNIISTSAEQQTEESVDPKVSSTAYIVKMLAEVRALGEAIIIADQLPTAMTSEVLKNTGLKIVHRLTAQDDRSLIGGTMSASQMQIEELSTYQSGQALLFFEGLRKPFTIQMTKWKGKDIPTESDINLFMKLSQYEMFRYYLTRSVIPNLSDLYYKETIPFWKELRTYNNKIMYCRTKYAELREKPQTDTTLKHIAELEKKHRNARNSINSLEKSANALQYRLVSFEPFMETVLYGREYWDKGIGIINLAISDIAGKPPHTKKEGETNAVVS